MEIKEKNGFSIIGFIAQVLLMLLFVLVLLWIFPTKSYLEERLGSGFTSDNSVLNEMMFSINLNSMKDAAREYYTVKRMPATSGSSKQMTLGEMIDNRMVTELADTNGNKCSRADSYVKVTKVDGEYEMVVSLTCGNVTKVIKTTIGCYNYCESGMCEKQGTEVTLYQYSKKVAGTEGWSSWSKWSKTVVTPTSTREVETKIVNEKIGTTTETVPSTEVVDYTCPSDYKISSDKLSCSKTTSTTNSVPSTKVIDYTCPSGYKISSDKLSCSKTEYKYADLVPVYTCDKGTLNGTVCEIKDTVKAIPHVKVSFSCSNGVCQNISTIDYYYCADSSYTVYSKSCVKTREEAAKLSSYTCPKYYDKNASGTKCLKAIPKVIDSTKKETITCPTSEHKLSEDKTTCSINITSVSTIDSTKTTTYVCSVGTLNKNNTCDIVTDVYSDVTYYRYRTFTKTSDKTYYKWSKSSNDKSLIKAGYKYTGVTKTSTEK